MGHFPSNDASKISRIFITHYISNKCVRLLVVNARAIPPYQMIFHALYVLYSVFFRFLSREPEITKHTEHKPEPHHSRDLIFCTRDHVGELTALARFLIHTLLSQCVMCSFFWSSRLPFFPKTPMFFVRFVRLGGQAYIGFIYPGPCQNASMIVLWSNWQWPVVELLSLRAHLAYCTW